jgi:hypothetical protein
MQHAGVHKFLVLTHRTIEYCGLFTYFLNIGSEYLSNFLLCAKDAHFDIREGRIDDFSDLGVTETLVFPENENFTVFIGDHIERRSD